MKEVLTLLEAYQSVTSLKITNLIIAGHSGGGDMMRAATGAFGKMLPNLKECWGFDCMYAGGHTYGCWADGLPGVYMYFYLANGSSAAYFADFWKFAYGTPAQPEPQPMNNLFLAPATQGIENMTDQIVFQSVDDIKNKSNQGTKLNAYETIRLKVDALLDTPKAYDSTLTPTLKEHFEVVRDMMKPRIIGLTGAKLTGTRGDFAASTIHMSSTAASA